MRGDSHFQNGRSGKPVGEPIVGIKSVPVTVSDEIQIISPYRAQCGFVELRMIGCERSARLDPDTVIVEPIRDDAVRTNTVLDRNQLITMTVQTIDPIVCRRIGDS